MNNLKIRENLQFNKIILEYNKDIFTFELISDSNFSKIAEIDDVLIYEFDESLKATLEKNNSGALMTFYTSDIQNLIFKINTNKIYDSFSDYLVISNDAVKLKIISHNCKISYNNNKLAITNISNESSLQFEKVEENFKALLSMEEPPDGPSESEEITVPGGTFNILTDTDVYYFVQPNTRGPEFSIGIFDLDGEPAAGKRARPVRLGVPVISTIPVYQKNMSEDDLYYYEKGSGPQFKVMYFRVVCNKEIQSQTVKLLIYMPNGLDTISAPDAIILKKVSTSGNPSVYHGNYTFFKQDNQYSVDGFVYFAIYLDMVQQIILPTQATDQEYAIPDNRQILRDLY